MIAEGELLWEPSASFRESSNMAALMRWLERSRGLRFDDYEALRRWSVSDVEAFWAALWEYYGVLSDAPYVRVLGGTSMLDARWFEGSRVNYAEHLLRHSDTDDVVFRHVSELRPMARMTWRDLARQVRVVATRLRELGVRPGDRVVGYMPNIPETAIAMIATIAIGAVWSSAAPEFGVKTVVERFAQIRPKVLFAADGYRFGGKDFDRGEEIRRITAQLPELERVIFLPYLRPGAAPTVARAIPWADLLAGADVPAAAFRFERVPFDHPMWVLFSSGTTGLPKAIAHSHVGVLLEHLKTMSLHIDLGPESCLFFYSTTGWMMFNILIAALLVRSAAVLYDGHPAWPGPEQLWTIADAAGATCFGASPTFVQMMQKVGLRPRERFELSRLTTVLLSGSVATPETFGWFYRDVKRDLWVTSQSGGTEICSAFVGASPTLPVHAGEIQARSLGMDVRAWSDDGAEVMDEVGELVVTKPFPSMPLRFWDDEGGRRYREAYFDHFPGVWRHGDFLRINRRGGCYIYGRSDSTLNRHGVRIGTSEIYRCVEQVAGVMDSLVVCCDLPDGGFYMPLFVRLEAGAVLDDDLRRRVSAKLRHDCSPRHVPDEILQVDAIPYTLTGKKMEVPVRKILMGTPPERAASRDAMMDPRAIDRFVELARSQGAGIEPARVAARP